MPSSTVDQTFQAYVECALWSSTDEGWEPLDGLYGPEDIEDRSLDVMRDDVADFLEGCGDLIDASGLEARQVGHDFWLTRNRHGAGFWDRGLGKVGDELTAMAHPYGAQLLYVGDDGLVYVS